MQKMINLNFDGEKNGLTQMQLENQLSTRSLVALNPERAQLWHPTKNGELTAYDVSIGSSKIVWWTNNYGHDWQEKIHQRVKRFQKQNDSDQISLF
jgi:hypothetical protein